MHLKKSSLLALLFFFSLTDSRAQAEVSDTFVKGELGLKTEALAFFRDNEYDGDIQKGYTLPGAWVRPALTYNPLDSIHLELGASGLFYSGANKYPCWAYHDIAKWKGNQYQSGVHLLPWFRAEMKMGHFDIVLGDIYGGTTHRLPTPLYNKEQILSADPEMGAQIRFDTRCYHLDVFCNWQSFQFREDSHQEAFTVGLTTRYTPFRGRFWEDVEFNGAVLVQHRGGELDATDDGVQTLCNGSLGVAWDKTLPVGVVNHLRAELDVMGCYQQAGHMWPFDTGLALHGSFTTTILHDLHAQLGYLHAPSHFVTLYGNPFFSTISLKHPELTFTSQRTAYLDFGYSHTFARHYTFGTNLEAFYTAPGGGKGAFTFSFGLYMHINPEFLLKKF